MSKNKSGFGGQLPNSQRVGKPRSRSFGISNRVKLASGLFAVAITFGGIIWVTKETLKGKEQEAVLSLTATAVYNECTQYYNELNAQMEQRGLPPFVMGNDFNIYCDQWATRTPGFNK